jgi:transposase
MTRSQQRGPGRIGRLSSEGPALAEGWARRFFEHWRAALKWQRLRPYEKFAAMIERHWEGFAAYCRPEHKVALGFVEGLNNKIRVLQRRAYGLRDEAYLRLKVLTCMLPAM